MVTGRNLRRSPGFLCKTPGGIGERCHKIGHGSGMFVRGCAITHAADDALQNAREAEEIISKIEVDIVDAYLNSVAVQARSMGFSQSYMRNQLSHISTEVQITDENKAKVKITGERLRSINPVFALVGKLFFLIESHKVDETLTLVKEDDKWKVCGKPFSLSEI